MRRHLREDDVVAFLAYFFVIFSSVCSTNSPASSEKRSLTGYHSSDGASHKSRCCSFESGGGALIRCTACTGPSPVLIISRLTTLNTQGSASRRPATKNFHSEPGLNFSGAA